MDRGNDYLILNENRNAMDFLIQSLTFLSQVEQNLFYWKWFIIAFHSAVYSFILLVIQSIDQDQIYQIPPQHLQQGKGSLSKDDFNPFDGKLISFLSAYKKIRDPKFMKDNHFISSSELDDCMKELNNKLRNQMIHFSPMIWGAQGWYPASVCQPILPILTFCVKSNNLRLSESEHETVSTHISCLNILLAKHSESFDPNE